MVDWLVLGGDGGRGAKCGNRDAGGSRDRPPAITEGKVRKASSQ